MTLTTDVYFSQMDVTVECEVEFTPVKATRDSWGYAGGEPGEPAHVENMRATVCGVDFTAGLTPSEVRSLEDLCLEAADYHGTLYPIEREDR